MNQNPEIYVVEYCGIVGRGIVCELCDAAFQEIGTI